MVLAGLENGASGYRYCDALDVSSPTAKRQEFNCSSDNGTSGIERMIEKIEHIVAVPGQNMQDIYYQMVEAFNQMIDNFNETSVMFEKTSVMFDKFNKAVDAAQQSPYALDDFEPYDKEP